MLRRAIDYPYHSPNTSFLFFNGAPQAVDHPDHHRTGKTALIAFGSNRSPYQLKYKFGNLPRNRGILVEPCRIKDFDVAHAARLTAYGAFPAALIPAVGVEVGVAIIWLNKTQLMTMDATEALGSSYVREQILVPVHVGENQVISNAVFYRTLHKSLRVDGQIVASAATQAEGRSSPAFSNQQLLGLAHLRFCPEKTFEEFLLRIINDNEYRSNLSIQLAQQGLNRKL